MAGTFPNDAAVCSTVRSESSFSNNDAPERLRKSSIAVTADGDVAEEEDAAWIGVHPTLLRMLTSMPRARQARTLLSWRVLDERQTLPVSEEYWSPAERRGMAGRSPVTNARRRGLKEGRRATNWEWGEGKEGLGFSVRARVRVLYTCVFFTLDYPYRIVSLIFTLSTAGRYPITPSSLCAPSRTCRAETSTTREVRPASRHFVSSAATRIDLGPSESRSNGAVKGREHAVCPSPP